ncbi:ubiquitin-associated domain-containing protein 1 isoform X1 [Anopheles funestus]|uniref:ubiquitin-associated domain-containing protein 1 isoform X1 n=1 Tax=Anopheles funestus TaxID=62324 RepID=UPI0020C6807A|nr:ubiquitin-associated domain-containing protein 1 isoform X1 [Anopheles funestus]
MIPWMREKFAERRARWQQSRNKQPRGLGDGTSSCSSASSSTGPEPSSGTTTPGTNVSPVHQPASRQHKHRHGQRAAKGQHQSNTSQQPLPSTSGSWRSRSTKRETQDDGPTAHCSTQSVLLRIISPRGGMVDVEVLRTLTGRQLKMYALEKFASNAFTMPHFSSDLDELADRYRMIRSHNSHIFRDDDLLRDVNDEEEFLLVAKRIDSTPAEESLKGPSPAEILAATRHIPLSRINQASVNFNLGMLQSDLQQDLRRIMISLSRASAYVHGTGPCADKLIALFQQRLINRKRHQISSVETLLEMGFSLDKINQALQITKNVFPAALDWLIQNDSTSRFFNCDKTASNASTSAVTNQIQDAIAAGNESPNDCSITAAPIAGILHRGRKKSNVESSDSRSASTPSSAGHSMDEEDCDDGEHADPFTIKRENIAALLEIVHLYSEKTVVPMPELVSSIAEMGFEEENVREALIATHNNQAAACEWLLGNRAKSVQGLNDGLPPESPILRVLMGSPQVQISLGNPKMFIALISMLDNSSTMTMWLSDNDTSSVLGHILRTYHEEKHIVAINQFNNAQGSSGSQQ